MRYAITIFVLLNTFLTLRSQDCIEIENTVSDGYNSIIDDIKVIRPINGGTIITPIFDTSCPEECKTPFTYACKIVEEYMPSCLPLNVKVIFKSMSGISNNTISKVNFRSLENFGDNIRYENAPMSMIKGVILEEFLHGSRKSYLQAVPNVSFLTETPDITITYNLNKIDELSFSLETTSEHKYDFVSIAVRDLLSGLGISSSFRANVSSGILLDPTHGKIPFESAISSSLGTFASSSQRYANATKGELNIGNGSTILKLYAPNPWDNSTSLKYFIPQSDCDVSKVLSYNFSKGMIVRSLADNYCKYIFEDLLGWQANYTTSSGSSGVSNLGGSTSSKMDYNGSFEYKAKPRYVSEEQKTESIVHEAKTQDDDGYSQSIDFYLNQFNPALPYVTQYEDGIAISILKKDGTWDMVYFFPSLYADLSIKMSDLEFHYDMDTYARSVDGYLRARLTEKTYNPSSYSCRASYFIIDHLPQKVELNYKFVDSPELQNINSTASTSESNVRLFFSGIEGINRLVLERKRSGSRVPSKTEIPDFKKGYYDTTVDRTVTFTAVAYNDNGYTRGVPVTVSPITQESDVRIEYKNNVITVLSDSDEDSFEYSIMPIDAVDAGSKITGKTTRDIDISEMPNGYYVVNVKSFTTGQGKSFKFVK